MRSVIIDFTYFEFLITSSTGQRREILTAFIYCCLLLLSVSGNKNFNINKPSKKLVGLGAICVLLIAITWYGRVFFGQIYIILLN